MHVGRPKDGFSLSRNAPFWTQASILSYPPRRTISIMGVGILDDHFLKHVPGTSRFSKDPNDAAAEIYEGVDLNLLKHGRGKHSKIILVPQPSDDPNDPLNWSTVKKHMHFFVLVYGTVLAGALGPLVSGAQVQMAAIFDTSLSNISRILGTSLVATLAVSTIFWSALAVKIGKRPVYIISSVLLIIGTIISSQAKTTGTLLASRIIQGVGQAPLEFLSLADLYFTHERGWPVAAWTLALLNGINITPPISGIIFDRMGFRWNFRFFAIASGVLLILQIFFLPESTYIRNTVVTAPAAAAAPEIQKEAKRSDEQLETATTSPQKNSYLSELALFHRIFDRETSIFFLIWEPLSIVPFSPTGWSSLSSSLLRREPRKFSARFITSGRPELGTRISAPSSPTFSPCCSSDLSRTGSLSP